MRRFRVLFIVEAVILVLLAMRLLTNHRVFIPAVVLAVVFSWLASGRRRGAFGRQIFGCAAGLFWIFIVVIVLTTGFFWLLLIWPLVYMLFIYRHAKRTGEEPFQRTDRHFSADRTQKNTPRDVTDERESLSADVENDVIDLADMIFHETTKELTIRKAAGNTKIIVPDDVGVSLNVTAIDGVIRIFDETPKIDAANVRYQSPDYESRAKRAAIQVRVVSGNIEIVRG